MLSPPCSCRRWQRSPPKQYEMIPIQGNHEVHLHDQHHNRIWYLPRAEDEHSSSDERQDARKEDEGVPVVKVGRLRSWDKHGTSWSKVSSLAEAPPQWRGWGRSRLWGRCPWRGRGRHRWCWPPSSEWSGAFRRYWTDAVCATVSGNLLKVTDNQDFMNVNISLESLTSISNCCQPAFLGG